MEERADYKTIWTTQQLATKAGVGTSYIRRLLRQGEIKGQHLGRDWVVSDSEARRWLESRKENQ